MATKKKVAIPEPEPESKPKPAAPVEVYEPEEKKGPGFPPIGPRFEVLMGTDTAALVDWVKGLKLYSGSMSVEVRKQSLVAAILISEFGTKEYIRFRLTEDRER